MIRPITVKNITIGKGIPKVVVPIIEKSEKNILEKAKKLASLNIHMVEWRADFYEGAEDTHLISKTLAKLRETLTDKILLFTFRTSYEGGNGRISRRDYLNLNLAAAHSGNTDFIDVEAFFTGEEAKSHIAAIKSAGAYVIGSNHDFSGTPPKDELVRRLRTIQSDGADISKIAVMPRCREDVLTLLAATLEMYSKYAERPIITMSMAPMGVVSRLAGEVFGSSMTFGSAGSISAPGQISVEQLLTGLSIVHYAD